jgi:hypothetical protein
MSYCLEDLEVDERIILKWVERKEGRREWIGLIWLKRETRGGIRTQ